MREQVINKLSVLLADTYAVYLKTQNYHWHVVGPQFSALHQLFETGYKELAEAVDQIAERIRIMGCLAPATFTEYQRLKTIQDGRSDISANQMLLDLVHDHGLLLNDIDQALQLAQQAKDEGSVDLLTDRMSAHEKMRWMLSVSCDQPS
jgi:starvation-inducible DNA-binding protein